MSEKQQDLIGLIIGMLVFAIIGVIASLWSFFSGDTGLAVFILISIFPGLLIYYLINKK
ncbi:MAG: hypothetical protein ACXACP_02900 [Candidatus Hodarchaeales archaeon]